MMQQQRNPAGAPGIISSRFGNPWINLCGPAIVATFFARLGALGHLDLNFLRVDEVIARHAEAAGGDLLDGAVLESPRWFVQV